MAPLAGARLARGAQELAMRQVLFSNNKAIVARMPRPTPAPGTVLVRVHYSLISTGTELATLRPFTAGAGGATTAERVSDLLEPRPGLSRQGRSAIRALAADRVMGILGNAVRQRVNRHEAGGERGRLHARHSRSAWQEADRERSERRMARQPDDRLRWRARPLPGLLARPCCARRKACFSKFSWTVPGRQGRVLDRPPQRRQVRPGSAWCPFAEGPLNEVIHFDTSGNRTR